jgi:hypothetical protein
MEGKKRSSGVQALGWKSMGINWDGWRSLGWMDVKHLLNDE